MTKLRLTDAEKPMWMMAYAAVIGAYIINGGQIDQAYGAKEAANEADAAIEALRERVEGGV